MYLLDTNHCSAAIDPDPAVWVRLAELAVDEVPVSTCVIVQSELLYMVHRSDFVERNSRVVERFLTNIAIYLVDDETARIDAGLKAALFDRYGPKDRAERRRVTLTDLGFDENDLWIAATALQHDLTVVTADRGFARIATVAPLQHESWLLAEGDQDSDPTNKEEA